MTVIIENALWFVLGFIGGALMVNFLWYIDIVKEDNNEDSSKD